MASDSTATNGTPALAFEDVSKEFTSPTGERLTVLDGLSFQVTHNKFTALVGPSGCGKTTLFRLATGLDHPTEGRTLHEGAPVTRLNQQLGYVTQEATLFPWYTLYRNVELPLRLRGEPERERARKVEEYLALARLTGFEDHYPHQLSGGMQKRASIVRTLIYEPRIILMDEPFGALDAQTRMLMHRDLLQLWESHATTLLFITHDLTEAITLADEIILLSRQPTRVKDVIDVTIPRPRDVFEPYEMNGFIETHDRVWKVFRSEVLDDV